MSEATSLKVHSRESPARAARRKRASYMNYAVLMSVPVFWGTFTPSMKLLLDHHHSPPVILTNLCSHAIGTVALALLWLCEALPRQQCLPDDEVAPRPRRVALASFELGVYLFFGQLTQLLGLGGTSATSNAILVQSSVVIVPLFEAARIDGSSSGSSGSREWMGRCVPSLLALAGIATITIAPKFFAAADAALPHGRSLAAASTAADYSAAGASSAPSIPQSAEADDAEAETTFGVLCSLLSAAFYALHTVRLSEYGDVNATLQATGQVAVNACLDLASIPLATLVAGGGSNSPLRWLKHAAHADLHHSELRQLGYAALWNGVVVVGATTWAMSYAQRTFAASTAVVAYAMEPLFAALFAAAFLKEAIGPFVLVGGALIIAANVVAGLRLRTNG